MIVRYLFCIVGGSLIKEMTNWNQPSRLLHTTYQTSTTVFYRTRVYQMQLRNGQNWHSSVRKYVHHNRKTTKIRFAHL